MASLTLGAGRTSGSMAMPLCVLTTKPCVLRFAGAGFCVSEPSAEVGLCAVVASPIADWPGAGDAKHGGGMVTPKAWLWPITPEAI